MRSRPHGDGGKSELTSDERAELATLRKENREMKMEREVSKRRRCAQRSQRSIGVTAQRIKKKAAQAQMAARMSPNQTRSEVAKFRADLVTKGLGDKRINNILAVLSKPLKYTVDCEVLVKAPKIGMFKVERPEIIAWDFEQYARLLVAAKSEGDEWFAGVCLAGEAGLRIGEVKALRWREDVDMIAKTITINFQTRNGQTTTPKGRTRRAVKMTTALYDALKRMSVVREGFVVRNLDGTAKTDEQADVAIRRICPRGLARTLLHTLRHSFGTHAALFGVNLWRLQSWMGHKRIDETMLYVHVAEVHGRESPEAVRDAGSDQLDPDARVLAMLGARGKSVAKDDRAPTQSTIISAA